LDITELREAHDKIASLAAIVDSSTDAIVGKTLEGIIVSWNPGAEILYGYSAEEAIGRSIFSLLAPLDQPDDFATIIDKIKHGETIPAYDTLRMRKDGTLVDVSLNISPVKDSMGKIIGAATIARDISERKKLEQRISQYAKELERSNKELGDFAAIVAHDLRAPLRAVSGFAGLLQKHNSKKTIDADTDKYISHIVEGSERMHHLINDLLQYAKAGSHSRPLVQIDVNDIIEKTLANLTFEIQASNAEITVDRLPMVSADNVQLMQLFQNLVANAIKYRSNTPRIHISAEQKKKEWIFRVSDNGIGIDPHQFKRIFEVFQRLHTKEEYSGTGIGLAICKKIVERFGGRIWVESKPGEGSTFFFTLPK
jgi:PAS domain S-box-containing protein